MKRFCLIASVLLATGLFSCDETVDPASDKSATELAFSDAGGLISTAPGGTDGGTQQPSGVITAGEWNDLEHWNYWQELLARDTFKTNMQTWGFTPVKRYAFVLRDQHGDVAADAVVKIKSTSGTLLWEGRTDNFGRAELWPNVFDNQSVAGAASITYKSQLVNLPSTQAFEQGENILNLPLTATNSNSVDVMFVVDATGSMGDELEYLKLELLDVLDRAAQTPDISLRTASVFYRDKDDEYVTRSSGFTNNNSTTVDFVKNQSAAGGGDWPEAVHSALENAIVQQNWSATAKARLLFLVLDAPPHEDDAVKSKIRELTKLAAAKGIKIIPVSASGVDKKTEFLLRFMATSTNGTYVFITNHSGIGNDHIEATVGEYEVEFLNDLMVRLIQKYSE